MISWLKLFREKEEPDDVEDESQELSPRANSPIGWVRIPQKEDKDVSVQSQNNPNY